jgi:hypothetical protein
MLKIILFFLFLCCISLSFFPFNVTLQIVFFLYLYLLCFLFFLYSIHTWINAVWLLRDHIKYRLFLSLLTNFWTTCIFHFTLSLFAIHRYLSWRRSKSNLVRIDVKNFLHFWQELFLMLFYH